MIHFIIIWTLIIKILLFYRGDDWLERTKICFSLTGFIIFTVLSPHHDDYPMGNLLERSRDDEIEEESIGQLSTNLGQHGYLYPPRSGSYFAGHFIMGGEKFETGQPEAYLFGDNMDLNFLGPTPVPFPYLAPLPDEPTRSLRALINIRKETLRLIKIPCTGSDLASSIPKSTSGRLPNQLNNDSKSDKQTRNHQRLKELPSSSSTVAVATTSSSQDSSNSSPSSSSLLNSSTPAQTNQPLETNQLLASSSSSSSSNGPLYTIGFTFDSDVKCSITIYYLSLEEATSTGLAYIPRDPNNKTETFYYPKGAGQVFSQPSVIFNPMAFNEDGLLYRAIDEYGNFDSTVPFPIVIQVAAEEGSEPRQSHSLIATVERNNEKQFYIKPFKQKIIIDGLAYLIQEVYGIENKNTPRSSCGKPAYYSSDEDIEDNGSECVICMSESRDTLILPCRHLCLCNTCADSLRYQANNCPICRSPFRALLQFRAVRKISPNGQTVSSKNLANVIQPVDSSNISSSSKRLSNSSESRNGHPTSSVRPITTTPAVDDTKSDTPPGYEAISLIEALNGPSLVPSSSLRPGDFGSYAYQGSSDDEDVAPLASIEATTKSISGSSQSMIIIKDRDTLSQLKDSISNGRHSQHTKSSSLSLSEIRYPIPSSSSPKMIHRSKSISKSKLAMINSAAERGGRNKRSSESLTLWSQQGSPESESEDQERVKLLDQENYCHYDNQRQKQTSSNESTTVHIEPTRSLKSLRKRRSIYDDSEAKALNSSSHNSSNNQLEMDSIEALDINSVNLSANSYPDLFLRDGVDEQRFMDETDLISVSTTDSVPN